MRAFAQTALLVVMRHMTLLEGTGLADARDLVADPVQTKVANQTPIFTDTVLLSAGLGGALILLTVLLLRAVNMRRSAASPTT